MIKKILLLIGKSLSKASCKQTSVVYFKYIWEIWDLVPPQENFSIFTVIYYYFYFYSNCHWKQYSQYLNWKEIVIWSWSFLFLGNWYFKFGFFLSPTNTPCLKDCPHNLTKYEFKETSKITISQLFSQLGTIWKYSLDIYQKKIFFYVYSTKLEKIKYSSQ